MERGIIETADGVTVAESFPVGGGKNPVYVRRVPAGLPVRKPGRLQLHRGRPVGDRALRERLPGRGAQRVHLDHRPDPRRPAGGRRRHPDDRRRRRSGWPPRRSSRRSPPRAGASGVGGGVVALDPSTGAVEVMASVPGFDPEPGSRTTATFKQLNRDQSAPLVNRPTQSTYPPGLDDEGGDRRRGASTRASSPRARCSAAARRRRSAACPSERGRRAVRRHRHDRRAHQLGQHLLGPGRRAARQRDDVQVHGAVRVLPRTRSSTTRTDQMAAERRDQQRGRAARAGDGFDVGRVAIGQGGPRARRWRRAADGRGRRDGRQRGRADASPPSCSR